MTAQPNLLYADASRALVNNVEELWSQRSVNRMELLPSQWLGRNHSLAVQEASSGTPGRDRYSQTGAVRRV
jgi:hypothetical protein